MDLSYFFRWGPSKTINVSKEKAEAINRYHEGKMRPEDVEILIGPMVVITVPPPGQPPDLSWIPGFEKSRK